VLANTTKNRNSRSNGNSVNNNCVANLASLGCI
jgi:hypothetical protein